MASSPTAKTRQQHGTNVTPFAKDPSIPVFHPSTQEFKDPVAYLSSIRQQAEPFGMCKIVPPSGWRPSFAINKEQCTLPTRIQALHMLQHISEHDAEVQQGNTGGKRFLIDYKAWLTRQGKTFRKPPQLYGQDVDLAALYSAVTRRGGFQACCDAGAWRTVAKALQVLGVGGCGGCGDEYGGSTVSMFCVSDKQYMQYTHPPTHPPTHAHPHAHTTPPPSTQIKDRRGDAANQLRTMYSKTLLDYEQEQCTTKTHAGGAPSTQPSTSGAAGAVGTVVVQDEDEKSAQTTTGGFDGGVGEGGQTSPAAGGGGYGKTRSKVCCVTRGCGVLCSVYMCIRIPCFCCVSPLHVLWMCILEYIHTYTYKMHSPHTYTSTSLHKHMCGFKHTTGKQGRTGKSQGQEPQVFL